MNLSNFFNDIKNYFNHISKDELINISLSLLSCKRTKKEAFSLLEHYISSTNILNELYKENIRTINNGIYKNKYKTIGILEMKFFGGQFNYIAKKINEDKKLNCLSIILKSNLEKNNNDDKILEFIGTPFIFVPDDIMVQEFHFLDAIIINEGYIYKTYIPKDIPRIIQPHGLDVSSHTTITRYGGGTIGNYILAPMREKKESEDLYKSFFPRKMIEHNTGFACVIPCGYPKLDEFIEKCDNYKCDRPKIILHFSHTSFQSKKACEDIGVTLKLLLENFPVHDVIFRPYPTEINEPIVVQAWENVKENPRAKLSTKSSYIDDYAGADFLVSHRIETGQTFAYATGNPMIYFPIEEDLKISTEHSRGYLVYNHEQLVARGNEVLADKDKARERIIKYRDELLCNPGHCLDYLIDNFEYILENKKHPNWQYFKLYDKDIQVDYEKEFETKLKEAIVKNKAFENMARSAVDNYPYNENFKYYLILALFKSPATTQNHYYFRWYEGMKVVIELYKNTKDKNIKNLIEQLYLDSLFSKLYQLKRYVNTYQEPFNILMAETLSIEEFNDYVKDYKFIIDTNLDTMHKLLDDTTSFQKSFQNFLRKYKDKKIVIWGAGETIDCLIPMISKNIFIVDKKLHNTVKILRDKEILIGKTEDIKFINPSVIIIGSEVFYEEIYKEIRKNYSSTINITSMNNFREG